MIEQILTDKITEAVKNSCTSLKQILRRFNCRIHVRNLKAILRWLYFRLQKFRVNRPKLLQPKLANICQAKSVGS